MLNNKLVYERPAVPRRDGPIPDGGDEQSERRSPQRTQRDALRGPLASKQKIGNDDAPREDYSDQTFGEQRSSYRRIKSSEPPSPLSFARCRLREEEARERRRQRHRHDDIKARPA